MKRVICLLVGLVLSVVEGLLPSSVSAVSCGLSDNATNTLNTACVIDGPPFTEGGSSYYSGIANGDMVVSGADVTVSPGVTMTWSPGKAIMIQNGGRIIRGANAVLKQVDPMAWFRQQLGFDTYAAGVPVKILGQNLHVCTADPCTVTAPAGAGSLVVENSIKFADGTTQTTAASGGSPTGQVSFFNLASCPTGWTELTTARGMYMVGLPASGTLAGTSGTALTNLESRAVGQHLHSVDPASTSVSISDPGHRHSTWPPYGDGNGNNSGGLNFGCCLGSAQTQYTSTNSTGISASVDIAAFNSANAGSVAGTNAPYIQLLACQKS